MAGIKLSAGSLKFFTLIKETKINQNISHTILIILWIIVRQWGKSLHEVAFMVYFFVNDTQFNLLRLTCESAKIKVPFPVFL